MGLIARMLKSMESQKRVDSDFIKLIESKGIKPRALSRPGIDVFEFPAKEIEVYGNGETDKISVDRILFGFGDSYITAFKGSEYKEIESAFVKNVEV